MENTEDPSSAFSAPSTTTGLLSGGSSPSFMRKATAPESTSAKNFKKNLKTEQKKKKKFYKVPSTASTI